MSNHSFAFPNTQSIYEASNDIIFKKKNLLKFNKNIIDDILSALFLFSMMSLNNNKIFLLLSVLNI